MIDLDKLTPAPWRDGFAHWGQSCVEYEMPDVDVEDHVKNNGTLVNGVPVERVCPYIEPANAAFIALARNWLDVQERRKWCISHEAKFGWWLEDDWDKDGERFDPRRFDTVLEAWQAAVDYDRELTAKGE